MTPEHSSQTRPNLAKFLAASGALSRRAAAAAVKAGRVAVNGQTVLEPGVRVAPESTVTLDGKILKPAEKFHYVMLNKPRGYVCTASDVHAELKAVELIKLEPPCRLVSAGRLDKESEGMLLFSNDGAYVEQITHPRHRILKRYLVTLKRELDDREMRQMLRGVTDEGELLRVLAIHKAAAPRRYLLVLNEGRKREIRRLTAALGAPTENLRRIATGKLELGDLPVGKWRELTPSEVAASLAAAPLAD